MQQFPSNRRESFLDKIPTPALVMAWVVALCVALACLYWAIFSPGPASPPVAAPTLAAQQANPVPVATISNQQPSVATVAPATVAVQPSATPAASQPKPKPSKTPTIPPLQDPAFGYGVQINGLVGDPQESANMAGKVKMNWIKQQMRWGDFGHKDAVDWSGFDRIMQATNNNKLKVMLSIVTAPGWSRGERGTHGPPDDIALYADFVGQVVDRYKGRVHAIEVWNEQNLSREWATSPQRLSAADYVKLLKAAYATIKAKDPNIIVISGALSPTGVDDGVNAIDDFRYLQQMVDAGMLNYADCVGVHHNGYNIGPDISAQAAMQHPKASTAFFRGPFSPFNGGLPHHSWFFYDTLQTYHRLAGDKPLCVTEFGWASSQGYDAIPKNFDFAKDNTLQEQADYIVQAFALMRQWGFVKLAFLWNLDYGNKGNGPTDDVVPYSLVDVNGLPRPAFEALERMPKQ